jgi:hypothetical protein
VLAGKEVHEVRLDRDEPWEFTLGSMSKLRVWRLHVRRDSADAEKDRLVGVLPNSGRDSPVSEKQGPRGLGDG